MPNKEESKRKRMVVEEVKETDGTPDPKILKEAAKDVISPESNIDSETITEKEESDIVKEVQVVEPRKSPSIALWIIIPGIFLLGAILGGIVFYQRGVNSGQEATPTPTNEPTASIVPSASPSASLDLTKYTINIFNGSGIAGEAGRAKTLLTTAGFKVGSAGNAATYDYTKTIIKAKSTVDAAFVSALSTALGKSYVVDTAQTLASSSADTVQVVVGNSKAQ